MNTGTTNETKSEKGKAKILSITRWPILSIGESFDLEGLTATLQKLDGKDMIATCEDGEAAIAILGSRINVRGHEFRIRKVYGDFIVMRPVLGRPNIYIR